VKEHSNHAREKLFYFTVGLLLLIALDSNIVF